VKGSGISVTLIVLGMVESPYWEHNPGSREHAPIINPRIAPPMSPEDAAEAIFAGVERRKGSVVKPTILRALFLLNAVAPRLVASQHRRALPKRE
jgi:short-subunit dehydrogenase